MVINKSLIIQFTESDESDNFIYNTLKDKRNWISEWTRLKLAIPKLFKDRLKNVHVDPEPPKNGYYIKNTFEFYDKQNKVVIPSEISLKLIQYSLNLDIVPNCQKNGIFSIIRNYRGKRSG